MFKKMIALGVVSVGLTLSLSSVAASSNGIGVVNMQDILHTAPQVKKINANLKKQFSDRKDKILSMAKSLQSDMSKYSKNKAVMSTKKSSALKSTISTQQTQLRTQQMKYQQDLIAAQNKAMKGFLGQLKSAVTKVASAKHLSVVFPKNSLLYSGSDSDITSAVLSKLK